MKKPINTSHIEGLVYDHTLQVKVSGPKSKNPGVTFINGELKVATDKAKTNIVSVFFTYVTATNKNGGANNNYAVLEKLINSDKGFINTGAEATYVRIDSAIGLNEWYRDDNNLVSTKRNEGGFIHIINPNEMDENEDKRSSFTTDMLITGTQFIEADVEKKTPDKMIVRGYIFNFRNEFLPVEYAIYRPDGIRYFEMLECSPMTPVFTKVEGFQKSTVVRTEIREEAAFGDAFVRIKESTNKDFVISRVLSEPYPWDDENTITATEVKEGLANREIALATLKQQQAERAKTKDDSPVAAAAKATTAPKNDGYNF